MGQDEKVKLVKEIMEYLINSGKIKTDSEIQNKFDELIDTEEDRLGYLHKYYMHRKSK